MTVRTGAAGTSFVGSLSANTIGTFLFSVTYAGAGSLVVDTTRGALGASHGISARIIGGAPFSGDRQTIAAGQTWTGQVTFAGAGNLSANANLNMVAAATFAGVGSLSIDADLRQVIAVSYAGAGSLSIDADLRMVAAATFVGTGSMSVLARLATPAFATFSGTGQLSVAVVQGNVAAVNF